MADWRKRRAAVTLRPATQNLLRSALNTADPRARREFERLVASSHKQASTLTGESVTDGDDSSKGVETSHRRDFIALAAAVAFGAQLEQPATMIIDAADRSRVPATVRSGDIRQLQATADALAVWDRQSGGGATRHLLLGELRWGLALLDGSSTPAVRAQLAATVAELADSAAWATFDAGLHADARELFILGLRIARESGDLGMRAHVATGFARQEIHAGNIDGALDLVRLAQTGVDALTPNTISMLNTVKAMAYGRAGDADAFQRYAQLAQDTYAPDTIADDPAWMHYYTPAKLGGDLAGAQFDLVVTHLLPEGDRSRKAVPSNASADLVDQLAAAVRLYPDQRARSKAITAARLATLLYLERDLTGAKEAARTALDLASGVRSARLGSDLQLLARAANTGPSDDITRTIHTEARTLAASV
ncbi:hypothetical protein [Nocardia asiatica]|uniref:hypothetical protein n=1 Tax=Nocardia asiatica TaxID=209252 RepID=UPI0012FA469D|nr:hypothetical protein [Nocardia asiatica]